MIVGIFLLFIDFLGDEYREGLLLRDSFTKLMVMNCRQKVHKIYNFYPLKAKTSNQTRIL